MGINFNLSRHILTKLIFHNITMINDFFNWCVYVLEVIGNVTGMGYELANIVIFVFIQPLLILIFFILWRREVKKKNNLSNQKFIKF
jgi:hypothetical protein